MARQLFTSESVSLGHPDKVADQISDAILDACLAEDSHSKVACEVLVSTGLVVLAGEITTHATVDYQEVARETIKNIGYEDSTLGFDYRSCAVLVTINKQSPDISQGVEEGEGLYVQQGAGDQGMMFGYACDETKELMPLPIELSHNLIRELYEMRVSGTLPYLRPDAKAQVTVEYDEQNSPLRVHTIVISTQHSVDVEHSQIVRDMKVMIKHVVPKGLLDEDTLFYINPTGRFVVGGPTADCGVTGRKTAVDTYGGMARHGGGAFSGKDPSKVDRSAAYAARYVAKNIVAAKLARRCEVQLAYAIGLAEPVSIKIETFGTAVMEEDKIADAVAKVFDLSPKGINEMLNLNRPLYLKTAWGGHFGRGDADFPWEATDRAAPLLDALNNGKQAQEGVATLLR